MGVAEGGRCDFVIWAEVVEVVERGEVIEREHVVERFEIQMKVQTIQRYSTFNCERGPLLVLVLGLAGCLRRGELVNSRDWLGVPDQEYVGVAYVSRLCRLTVL